ncbi:MAG TPA: hypothetical protein VKY89_06830, partial [Thermoanaerobaculia bacterium]|nr:hypothetical protein [Thermoanaerobaculia bacterium]
MRRPDNEPLLFDLPLDRPARDDESEPVLERRPQSPPRPPRPPHDNAPPQRHPRTGRPPQGGDRVPSPAAGVAPPAPATPATPPAAAANRSVAPRTGGPAPAAEELPLQRPTGRQDPRAAAAPAPAARRPSPQAEIPGLPFSAGMAAAGGTVDETGTKPAGGSGRVGIGRRLAAGAADLLVHVAVAILALAGCRYLGVVPALRDWPAIAIFLLAFSFLYTVVPLAFWGHTLGMTW